MCLPMPRNARQKKRVTATAFDIVLVAITQLMAHYETELRDLARAQARDVIFEASVTGGMPVLRALHGRLAGDRLGEVRAILIVFFSSRRRHTRCSRDWSSDVCSSD